MTCSAASLPLSIAFPIPTPDIGSTKEAASPHNKKLSPAILILRDHNGSPEPSSLPIRLLSFNFSEITGEL